MISFMPSDYQLPKPLVNLYIPLLVSGVIGGTLAWVFDGVHNLILGPSLLLVTGAVYVYLSYLKGSIPAREFLRLTKATHK